MHTGGSTALCVLGRALHPHTLTPSHLWPQGRAQDTQSKVNITPQPTCLLQLFSGLTNSKALHWTVRISYLEIYNESFRDLLCLDTPSNSLIIHEEK